MYKEKLALTTHADTLILIRHGVSNHNVFMTTRETNDVYRQFRDMYDQDPISHETAQLAKAVEAMARPHIQDSDIELSITHTDNIIRTGMALQEIYGDTDPTIVYVSPYKRTLDTLLYLQKEWPALKDTTAIADPRLQELDYGLLASYTDRRTYFALNPDQYPAYNNLGADAHYHYRYPQGESFLDLQQRVRYWLEDAESQYPHGLKIAVTHYLVLFAIMAELGGWDRTTFLAMNTNQRPINSGVTIYEKENPENSNAYGYVLRTYNAQFYE